VKQFQVYAGLLKELTVTKEQKMGVNLAILFNEKNIKSIDKWTSHTKYLKILTFQKNINRDDGNMEY